MPVPAIAIAPTACCPSCGAEFETVRSLSAYVHLTPDSGGEMRRAARSLATPSSFLIKEALEISLQSISSLALAAYDRIRVVANRAGELFGLLGIRLLLAWEFGEAGVEKWRGSNWFEHVQADFPFPFNIAPVELTWFVATWSELLGAAALAIGFATRFFSVSLFILTIVAWVSVHAGNGYNVCDNGFKLPLIYMVMLVPLILSGPGKLSVDDLLFKCRGRSNA